MFLPLFFRLIYATIAIYFLISLQDLSFLYKSLVIVNTIIAVWNAFAYRENPYSLHKITNIFILFFFILAHAIQTSHHSVVASVSVKISMNECESFQMIVFFILVLYNLIYYSKYKSYRVSIKSKEISDKTVDEKKLIFVSLVSALFIAYQVKFNVLALLYRGETGDSLYEGPIALLIDKFFHPIPSFCLCIALFLQTKIITRIILFFLVLAFCFPLSLARNTAAMYWMPIIFLMFSLFKRQHVFVSMMFFALLVLFPFFDIFRYTSDIDSVHYEFSLDYLDTMNFDAAQMLMACIQKDIVTYGHQLLGVFLFWVPRSLWPSKPVGSGAFIAGKQIGAFENVSMPYFGEGYINFGFIGIIAFTIVLAVFSSISDKSYWSKNYKGRLVIKDIVYLYLVGGLMFLLRGDLMSSIAYITGTVVSFMVLLRFLGINKKG